LNEVCNLTYKEILGNKIWAGFELIVSKIQRLRVFKYYQMYPNMRRIQLLNM